MRVWVKSLISKKNHQIICVYQKNLIIYDCSLLNQDLVNEMIGKNLLIYQKDVDFSLKVLILIKILIKVFCLIFL